ncbi:MAG TPA: hypothetical protein VHB93_01605 [Candidatus Paceibacterota bacterium]|nr:hypothetical protein [Candidatus Paceibacterota bacterium]
MARELIGRTKNGCDVYLDWQTSHALSHLSDTPELLGLIKEAVPRLEPEGDFVKTKTDFGRIVGEMDLVETDASSDIVYAKRIGRDRYTRFAKNAKPVPTSWVSIALQKAADGYEIYTAYVGVGARSFPVGDGNDDPGAIEFWEHHALAWGRQQIVPGTETTVRPW